MPGFSADSSTSITGKARSVYAANIASTGTTVFTATSRTIIDNVAASNTEGGVLPITFYVKNSSNSTIYSQTFRVYREKPRANADDADFTLISGLLLESGESLHASTPISGSFDVAAYLREGVR